MTNFMTLDLAGATWAAGAFAAILLAPGYVAGWALNLFSFRTKSLLERVAWGVGLSFATAPILVQLAGRVVAIPGLAIGFGLLAGFALALMFWQRRESAWRLTGPLAMLLLLMLSAAGVVLLELVDWQSGARLYQSVTTGDQAFRVGFTNAVAHTGIPPQNPFWHPGQGSPLRYYYFWYSLCAVCMKLAGVTARQALIASSVWCGIGLTAMLALFLRHFLGLREGLQRSILTGTLLLTVTGLDIVPVAYNLFVLHEFSGDLEWWSTDQIASWLDTILWVPNHTGALICCLMAFLLLWQTRAESGRGQRFVATALAGAAAASATGSSIYVAAGCVMLMAGWAACLLVVERNVALTRRIGATVLFSAVLLIPYLRGMLGSSSGTQAGASAGVGHLFEFSVRRMLDPALLTSLPGLKGLQAAHPVLLDQTARLILLLPGYALELGVFGLILLLTASRWKELEVTRRTAVGLALGGLAIVTLVRSSVIGNNDFGYRAALFPCFFMVLLAADWFRQRSPRPHGGLVAMLVLTGLAGTGFQALMLRSYVPLHVAAHMAGYEGLPEAAYAVRAGYAGAERSLPDSALLQSNLTDGGDYLYIANLLYSNRAMATDAEDDCGSVFGGDPARCLEVQQAVRTLYVRPAPSAEAARELCRRLGIGYLAAGSGDPAWSDAAGWVWELPLVGGPPGEGKHSDFNAKSGGDAGSGKAGLNIPAIRVVNCVGGSTASR